MKRAEILSVKGDIIIQHYDVIPKAPIEGAVIKTRFCGICHSDLHALEDEIDIDDKQKFRFSNNSTYKFPIVLGHEISGIIYSLGSGEDEYADSSLKVGDNVVVYPWTGCTECKFCRKGETNYCSNPLESIGFGSQGGFSEYIIVRKKRYIVKIPDSIPMDVAALLPCSALTGYNAVTKIKPTVEKFVHGTGKAAVLVVGAGGLGLWCLQTAKAVLPVGTKIISADVSKEKLKNALEHGADDTVLWDHKQTPERNIQLAKEKGFKNHIHAVIDFVNNSVTAAQSLGCLTKGGAIAMVGLFGGTLSIPLPLFAWGMYQISGVYVGSLDQFRELVALVEKYGLKSPNINHVQIEDSQLTLQSMKAGKIVGRSVVKF